MSITEHKTAQDGDARATCSNVGPPDQRLAELDPVAQRQRKTWWVEGFRAALRLQYGETLREETIENIVHLAWGLYLSK